jgi:hypothetical protein
MCAYHSGFRPIGFSKILVAGSRIMTFVFRSAGPLVLLLSVLAPNASAQVNAKVILTLRGAGVPGAFQGTLAANVAFGAATPLVIPGTGGKTITITVTPNVAAVNCPGGVDPIGNACGAGAADQWDVSTATPMGSGVLLTDQLTVAVSTPRQICSAAPAGGYALVLGCPGAFGTGLLYQAKGPAFGNHAHSFSVLKPPAGAAPAGAGACQVGGLCIPCGSSECAGADIAGSFAGAGTACPASVPGGGNRVYLAMLGGLLAIAAFVGFRRQQRTSSAQKA